jgi:protein SCO1
MPAAQQPRVLLVSVDPERDAPEKLGAYVRFFDESFHGATGTLDQVEQAAGAFMVPFAKVPTPDGNYTLDHGSGILFRRARGRDRRVLVAPIPAAGPRARLSLDRAVLRGGLVTWLA